MALIDLLKKSTPKYQTKIPSTGKTVWFRPFIVKEEKILLMAQETGNESEVYKGIVEIVNNCYDGIEDVGEMPIFDLEYLFLKLRSKSVQEFVTPILECPHTKENIKLNINLDDIVVKKFKEHKNNLKISDELIIQMKYPNINLFIDSNVENMQLMDFYDLAVSCIDYIETKDSRLMASETPKEELKEFVDGMNKTQFDQIIQFFATMPRIEHEVKYETSDGVERFVILKGIKDFFG